MASTAKKCRVCGKEYEACRSANRTAGVFRWQEVACSPECGAIYLQRIEESRGIRPKKVEKPERHKHSANTSVEVPAVLISASDEVDKTPEEE